tara:strand:- start:1871 stop:3094 length:1224 start_codon:yes stop_codon:yes gene_type:complete
MKELTKKFNLPRYIDGKSFAEASKIIESKFKGRTDKEAMDTKNDLMSRLRDAQEYVKQEQAYKESADSTKQPTHTMPDGTEMAGAEHPQDQYGYGGYKKETNSYAQGGPGPDPDSDLTEFLKRNERQVDPLDRGDLPTYEVPYAMEGNPQVALESNRTPNLDGSDDIAYDRKKIKGIDNVTAQGINSEYGVSGFEKTEDIKDPNASSASPSGEGSSDKPTISKLEKGLMAAGNIAPMAMNLAQLASLKKSPTYRSGRIQSTYEKQLTDEAAMQNAQATENAGQRNAMRSNSGSQSMLLGNLRGQGLNALKAQSSAYAQSVAANQQEERAENQFNTNKEQANINAQRQDDMINMQNEGAYDTTKSQLMAGLATDAGKMSKEALMKKYPELMGMDYDWLGKFNKKKKKK